MLDLQLKAMEDLPEHLLYIEEYTIAPQKYGHLGVSLKSTARPCRRLETVSFFMRDLQNVNYFKQLKMQLRNMVIPL